MISWAVAAQSTTLHEIEMLLSNAEYRLAADTIAVELKHKDLDSETRTRLYWLKALCHISEDQVTLAKSSLMNVLVTNPFFEPDPNASPKILKLFKAISADFKEHGGAQDAIRASFVPIDNLAPGMPYSFQIRLEDKTVASKTVRMELHLRRLGNSDYSSVDFRKVDDSGLFEAAVPPILTRYIDRDVTFEYYVTLTSENGERLGSIGRATLPLLFTAKQDSRPLSDENTVEGKRSVLTTVLITCATALAVSSALVIALILTSGKEGRVGLILSLRE